MVLVYGYIARVISGEPRTIRGLDAKLPKELDAICQKAMAKDPERRYATTAEPAQDTFA